MTTIQKKLNPGVFTVAAMLAQPEETRELDWLKTMVQFAVGLELSTIPPYLTALWSIKDTSTSPAPDVILPIALQEMLHMGTACNILTSLGATPSIADPKVVPIYPGHMPGGVHPALWIQLRPLSKELLADTFMPIEEPESGPVKYALGQAYPTIGAFYTAIQECIKKLPPEIFTGERQLVIGRSDFPLTAVKTQADALAAIEMIKSQGEGTSSSPLYGPDPTADMSHYYLFGELYHEHLLVPVPGKDAWEYTGDELPFPAPGDIYPMAPIPAGGYPESTAFDGVYSKMLRQLESAWRLGGSEGAAQLTAAQMTMSSLGTLAVALMQQKIGQSELTYGPCFRYVPEA